MQKFKNIAQHIVNHSFDFNKKELFSILYEGDINEIIEGSKIIREYFFGKKVHLCSILNTKSGACSEDCKYCAQSAHYNANIESYPFLKNDIISTFIDKNKETQIHRLSFVSSGRKLSNSEIDKLCDVLTNISTNKKFCASLGILGKNELTKLKQAGVSRYHHNIETSRSFYGNICTTHNLSLIHI